MAAIPYLMNNIVLEITQLQFTPISSWNMMIDVEIPADSHHTYGRITLLSTAYESIADKKALQEVQNKATAASDSIQHCYSRRSQYVE